MALTGFNPELVYSSIAGIQNAYDDLMQALITDIQEKFINPMGDCWACTDAKEFFENAVKAFESQKKGATRVFESVINSMNSSARSWASSTKSDYTDKTFKGITTVINDTAIKENINGVRGIDQIEATSAIAQLEGIKSAADAALDQAINAVTNCGFIGGNQEANLIGSLKNIQTNISTSFGELTATAKSSMDKTIENYGSIESSVSKAFEGN